MVQVILGLCKRDFHLQNDVHFFFTQWLLNIQHVEGEITGNKLRTFSFKIF